MADATPNVETVRRSTAFAFAVQLSTSAFTAVLTLFLVRALGADGYGTFALALAVGSLILLPADLGITHSTSRFVAEQRDDRAVTAAIVRDALRLKIAAAGVFAIVLFAAAGPIASAYGNEELTWVIRAIAVSLFAQSLFTFFRGVFVALGRIGVTFRLVLTESAVETGASIALVLLAGGAASAAWGRVAGYGIGAALALVVTLRAVGRSRAAGPRTRELARYAGALAVVDAAYALFGKVDVVLIGAYLNAAAVGAFQAPLRIVTFLHYPGLAVANGVAPRLARREGRASNPDLFVRALRLLIVVQAATVVPLLLWAEPLVELALGDEYRESADVLVALGPYIFLAGLAPLVSLAANYLGAARRRVPIAVATVAVNFAIDVVLIPEIGIVAGAIGTDVAYALYVPAHFWLCRDLLGFSARPVLHTLASAVLAGGAAAAVLAAFGPGELGVADVAVGLPLALLAYAAVLATTGGMSRDELRRLPATLRGRGRDH